MTWRWPFSWAVFSTAASLENAAPVRVPSTQHVLARALSKSNRRGSRVARWRTGRRWTVYHAWRHVLPVVLPLLVPASTWWLPGTLEHNAQPSAAQAPPGTPALPPPASAIAQGTAQATALGPVLQLTLSMPSPAARPASVSVVPPALVFPPVPLKADSSLHSQEP